MSWAVMIEDGVQEYDIPETVMARLTEDNPAYRDDATLALKLAKEVGLRTASLSGFRTPSPYGGPDTIGVSVMGTIEGGDWLGYVKANIEAGPDA